MCMYMQGERKGRRGTMRRALAYARTNIEKPRIKRPIDSMHTYKPHMSPRKNQKQ